MKDDPNNTYHTPMEVLWCRLIGQTDPMSISPEISVSKFNRVSSSVQAENLEDEVSHKDSPISEF